MPKRIVFDGMNLDLKRGTGVATYTRALANLTREMGHSTGILYSRGAGLPAKELDKEVLFFDYVENSKFSPTLRAILDFPGSLSTLAGVRPKKVTATGAVLTQPLLPSFVYSDEMYAAMNVFDRARSLFMLSGTFLNIRMPSRNDLFHWTFPLPMTSNARANIYTVHDIIPLRLPYTTMEKKRFYLRSMREILRKADHIVTVSENSKRDIMTYFGIEERRITNTYESVSIPQRYLSRSDDLIANELAGVFALEPRKYFLFFGSLEPKKNLGRVVQAYLSSNSDMPLVVVTAQSWLAEDEARLLDQIVEEEKNERKPRREKKIRRYEYVPFRVLVTLIQGARAVLFPSLYEGFGLPVLEAMTLGTPVITSNTSSLPEVAGDAAIQVDPYDVDAIRNAIVAVGADQDLCNDLRARGLKQSEKYSLAKYRERMEKLYASLT
jgi:glycosyltransferase involved in cell wall biosynthesis